MTERFGSLHAQVTLHEVPEVWRPGLRQFWGRSSFKPMTHEIEISLGPAQGLGEPVNLSWSGGSVGGVRQGGRVVVPGLLAFEVGRSGTQIEIGPEAPDRPQQTALALHVALLEAQRASGLLCLHAAVLRRGEQLMALTGPSGAGKSTAALRLLSQGWSLVAEDTSWLFPSGELLGWDEGLRLRPDSQARFAATWPQMGIDAHGKVMLSVPQASGGLLSEVVVLRPHTDGKLSGSDRVRSWWEMTGLPLTPLARQRSQAAIALHLPRIAARTLDRDLLIERGGPT